MNDSSKTERLRLGRTFKQRGREDDEMPQPISKLIFFFRLWHLLMCTTWLPFFSFFGYISSSIWRQDSNPRPLVCKSSLFTTHSSSLTFFCIIYQYNFQINLKVNFHSPFSGLGISSRLHSRVALATRLQVPSSLPCSFRLLKLSSRYLMASNSFQIDGRSFERSSDVKINVSINGRSNWIHLDIKWSLKEGFSKLGNKNLNLK